MPFCEIRSNPCVCIYRMAAEAEVLFRSRVWARVVRLRCFGHFNGLSQLPHGPQCIKAAKRYMQVQTRTVVCLSSHAQYWCLSADCFAAHQWLYMKLDGNNLLQFFCWTLYPACLCVVGSTFSHNICPFSTGLPLNGRMDLNSYSTNVCLHFQGQAYQRSEPCWLASRCRITCLSPICSPSTWASSARWQLEALFSLAKWSVASQCTWRYR